MASLAMDMDILTFQQWEETYVRVGQASTSH